MYMYLLYWCIVLKFYFNLWGRCQGVQPSCQHVFSKVTSGNLLPPYVGKYTLIYCALYACRNKLYACCLQAALYMKLNIIKDLPLKVCRSLFMKSLQLQAPGARISYKLSEILTTLVHPIHLFMKKCFSNIKFGFRIRIQNEP